jgi:PncC family amidohydrolase
MSQEQKVEEALGAALRERGLTMASAESCTGGLITDRLTNLAGSSEFMLGGIIAYANHAKQRLLAVRHSTLIDYGAVSVQTAIEMAAGARLVFDSDYAVSVTGIAGPGGGTETKPVGLTFIGLVGPDDLVTVERHLWRGDRASNKIASAEAALQLVLRYVQTQPIPLDDHP